MPNSTKSRSDRKPAKPAKPRKDFPLFPHATGRWAKKVRGKFCYFGKVADDPDGQRALELWLEQRDELLAGRKPRGSNGGLTVRDLINRFLTAKLAAVEARELSPITFKNYLPICQRLIDTFGRTRLVIDLAADDFDQLRGQFAKELGLNTRKVEIQRVRCIFRYAYEAALIDRPVRFGPSFKAPPAKAIQIERNGRAANLFEPAEIQAMLSVGDSTMKAMILLGVNCGFGNADCGHLTFKALDLEGGWVEFPRVKTGIVRRCPLWPETVAAIREVIAKRPEPNDEADADLVFITHRGNRFIRIQERQKAEDDEQSPVEQKPKWRRKVPVDSVGVKMKMLLDKLGLGIARKGFYTLRHVFETIGGEQLDQVAVDAIMGHSRGDMASIYRERISDERRLAVVNHVRTWLFGEKK